jgi:hypothetical protein
MNQLIKAPSLVLQYLLAGSSLLAVGYLLAALNLPFNTQPSALKDSKPEPNTFCSEMVQPKATVSREQLAQLLSVPERSQRRKVQQLLKDPYCRLAPLTIRAGATTERQAYPLASDPQTSLVVLYEGKSYVGYGFKRD